MKNKTDLFDLVKIDNLPSEAMNEIHREELEIVNLIFDKLSKDSIDQSELENQIFKFAEHLKEHFAFEEYLMDEAKCPILSCHQEEHQRVYAVMIHVFKQFAYTKDFSLLKKYFEFEYKPWIENHLKTMDLVTATFLENPDLFLNDPTAKRHSSQCD